MKLRWVPRAYSSDSYDNSDPLHKQSTLSVSVVVSLW